MGNTAQSAQWIPGTGWSVDPYVRGVSWGEWIGRQPIRITEAERHAAGMTPDQVRAWEAKHPFTSGRYSR